MQYWPIGACSSHLRNRDTASYRHTHTYTYSTHTQHSDMHTVNTCTHTHIHTHTHTFSVLPPTCTLTLNTPTLPPPSTHTPQVTETHSPTVNSLSHWRTMSTSDTNPSRVERGWKKVSGNSNLSKSTLEPFSLSRLVVDSSQVSLSHSHFVYALSSTPLSSPA